MSFFPLCNQSLGIMPVITFLSFIIIKVFSAANISDCWHVKLVS